MRNNQKMIEKEIVIPVQGNGAYSTCAIVQILHPAELNFDAAREHLMNIIWDKLNDKFYYNPYSTAPLIFYFQGGPNVDKQASQEEVNHIAQDALNEWMHQPKENKPSKSKTYKFKYFTVTAENLPRIAAEVMYYALTPELLAEAIKDAKSHYRYPDRFDPISTPVAYIFQPLYRYYKLTQRHAWNQTEITEDNKVKVLESILNEDGGSNIPSLKWHFIEKLYFNLSCYGNRNTISEIQQFGSEEIKNMLEERAANSGDIIYELNYAVSEINNPMYTLATETTSADKYIADIIRELKSIINSKSSAPQVEANLKKDQDMHAIGAKTDTQSTKVADAVSSSSSAATVRFFKIEPEQDIEILFPNHIDLLTNKDDKAIEMKPFPY